MFHSRLRQEQLRFLLQALHRGGVPRVDVWAMRVGLGTFLLLRLCVRYNRFAPCIVPFSIIICVLVLQRIVRYVRLVAQPALMPVRPAAWKTSARVVTITLQLVFTTQALAPHVRISFVGSLQ